MLRKIDYRRMGDDFSLKYGECFIRYRHTHEVEFETVQVTNIEPSNTRPPVISLNGIKSGALIVVYSGEGEFDFQIPDHGYFNIRNTGYYMYRLPARQNRRSFCPSTGSYINFYTREGLMRIGAAFDINTADAIFNPVYPKIEEILEALNAKKTYCVAFSREHALGLHLGDSPNHILFAGLCPIAEVTPEGRLAKCFNPALERFVYETPFI